MPRRRRLCAASAAPHPGRAKRRTPSPNSRPPTGRGQRRTRCWGGRSAFAAVRAALGRGGPPPGHGAGCAEPKVRFQAVRWTPFGTGRKRNGCSGRDRPRKRMGRHRARSGPPRAERPSQPDRGISTPRSLRNAFLDTSSNVLQNAVSRCVGPRVPVGTGSRAGRAVPCASAPSRSGTCADRTAAFRRLRPNHLRLARFG